MLYPPVSDRAALSMRSEALDRVTDVAENLRDLAAQEDEGDDRDDRDQGEDQRVLRETLTLLLAAEG